MVTKVLDITEQFILFARFGTLTSITLTSSLMATKLISIVSKTKNSTVRYIHMLVSNQTKLRQYHSSSIPHTE